LRFERVNFERNKLLHGQIKLVLYLGYDLSVLSLVKRDERQRVQRQRVRGKRMRQRDEAKSERQRDEAKSERQRDEAKSERQRVRSKE
jgi:hypothetical protein